MDRPMRVGSIDIDICSFQFGAVVFDYDESHGLAVGCVSFALAAGTKDMVALRPFCWEF